jgi:long-subunit fatty acid transport protein
MDFVSVHSLWSHGLAFPQTSYNVLNDKKVTSNLDTKGSGSGFVAGLMFKPVRFFQVGATFKQKISIEQSGTNRFLLIEAFEWTYVPTPFGQITVTTLLQDFYKFQSVTSSLTLPEETSVGILIRPIPKLELLFDYTKIRTSQSGDLEFNSVNSGENLNPEFNQLYGDFYGISPDYGTQKVGLTMKDSTSLRFGMELDLNSLFSVRAGYSTHKNSISFETLNPAVPDLEHSCISFGLGYEGSLFSLWSKEKISELSVDVYIQYILAKEQTSSYPGYPYLYDADRWVIGFGVGLNL